MRYAVIVEEGETSFGASNFTSTACDRMVSQFPSPPQASNTLKCALLKGKLKSHRSPNIDFLSRSYDPSYIAFHSSNSGSVSKRLLSCSLRWLQTKFGIVYGNFRISPAGKIRIVQKCMKATVRAAHQKARRLGGNGA